MSKCTVFISYNHEDSEIADKLKDALEQRGIVVRIDKAVMDAGADIKEFIETSVRDTDVTLSIVSNRSLQSAWVAMESITAFYNEKLQSGKKFIVCYIDEDFFKLDYRIKVTRLINARIEEIDKLIPEYTAERLDPVDLNSEKTRLFFLRNHLGEILKRLKASLAMDIRGAKFDNSVAKIVKTITKSQDEAPEATIVHEDFTESLPGGVQLEMVAIKGGSFLMGSKTFEKSQPIHKVTLKPFYMGKYPITQEQWKAVMVNNPSQFKGDRLPVESVMWKEAQEFCRKLSEITGKDYKLPSEAEWEYAARAGSTGDYCFGDDPKRLSDYAWYIKNSRGKTHPVGEKRPNAWGLFDVHGNIWEWCEDKWHKSYEGAPDDGSAWVNNEDLEHRVLRGGSWFDYDEGVRAVSRGIVNILRDRNNDLGFRVCCGVRPPSS